MFMPHFGSSVGNRKDGIETISCSEGTAEMTHQGEEAKAMSRETKRSKVWPWLWSQRVIEYGSRIVSSCGMSHGQTGYKFLPDARNLETWKRCVSLTMSLGKQNKGSSSLQEQYAIFFEYTVMVERMFVGEENDQESPLCRSCHLITTELTSLVRLAKISPSVQAPSYS